MATQTAPPEVSIILQTAWKKLPPFANYWHIPFDDGLLYSEGKAAALSVPTEAHPGSVDSSGHQEVQVEQFEWP